MEKLQLGACSPVLDAFRMHMRPNGFVLDGWLNWVSDLTCLINTKVVSLSIGGLVPAQF